MSRLLTAEATSKLGSVATVRGDASQLLALTTIPDRITSTRQETHVPTETTAAPDLDHPITAQQVAELYGITSGALQTNRDETGVVKVGSRMRHYLYDHTSIIRAFRDGKLGRPRAGGRGNRDAQWVAECRERIEVAIDALNVRETVARTEAARAAAEPEAASPAPAPAVEPTAPILPTAPPAAVAALQALARLEGMVAMLGDARERQAVGDALGDLRARISEL